MLILVSFPLIIKVTILKLTLFVKRTVLTLVRTVLLLIVNYSLRSASLHYSINHYGRTGLVALSARPSPLGFSRSECFKTFIILQFTFTQQVILLAPSLRSVTLLMTICLCTLSCSFYNNFLTIF